MLESKIESISRVEIVESDQFQKLESKSDLTINLKIRNFIFLKLY